MGHSPPVGIRAEEPRMIRISGPRIQHRAISSLRRTKGAGSYRVTSTDDTYKGDDRMESLPSWVTRLLHIRLVSGPLPTTIWVIVGVGVAILLLWQVFRSDRSKLARQVPIMLVCGGFGLLVMWLLSENLRGVSDHRLADRLFVISSAQHVAHAEGDPDRR